MKKKIINGILMVALLAATVTSFVSCKDNDEDVRTDLTAQLQKLNGDYQAADAALNNAIQAQLANKANQSDLDAWKAEVQKDYVTNAKLTETLNDYATKGYVDDETKKIWDALNGEGEGSVASQLAAIKASINGAGGINEQISDINKALEAVDGKLKGLQNQIDAIVTTLKNMVTSVTINATSNSILASSKVFPGLDAQVVGAAYGEPINAKGAFPSKETGLSEAALAGVEDLDGFYKWEDGEIITNEKDGFNAGTIYFTLNPSNVNPNNLKSLTLVNSQGKEIFELGEATASQEVLNWGITRAEYPTNLWEAPVKYDLESVKAIELKNVINFSALKNNVKNIIDAAKSIDKTKASVKNATSTILKETSSAVATLVGSRIPAMPAVALKATWEDTVGVRNVLSDYSIAATAYKPLSFSEFNGVSIGTDIDFTKVDNAVLKVVKRLKKELGKINSAVSKINIDTIEVKGNFNRSYTFWYELKTKPIADGAGEVQFINNLKILAKNEAEPENKGTETGGVKTDGWFKLDEFDINYNDDIKALVNSIKSGFDVAPLINEVSSALNSVNNAADRLVNLENKATDFLESYIKRTINFVSSGRFLEPILLVSTKNGVTRATGEYEAGKYIFIPTTVSHELLAPAFKKYIAVLDKDGKVIPGSQKILTKGDKHFSTVEVELTKDAAQVVYAAMDFRGYQTSKVYNVTVK